MPSNRWPSRTVRALRDAATHAHMRAELLPRLPFVIALVVSAVALVVAIEHPPGTDSKVVSVDEEPSGGPEELEDYSDDAAYYEEEVELEIVEYGFSQVAVDGLHVVIVAVVVRNPHDGELLPGGLSIQTKTERGYPVDLDTMYLGSIPPRSTAAIGYVMAGNPSAIDLAELELATTEPSMLYEEDAFADDGVLGQSGDPLPEFELGELEPLASPSGYRVHFTADAAVATETQISLLFRDEEGRLIGGVPADMETEYYSSSFRALPEGESAQYVDLTEEWIPEGTDLDRIEIGPSRY
ncbi:hypothetical protein [Glycomyces niveus]|uniref:DUF4352 domain-containing protein n=1 Tax=Glycomyces niveus TaxID=2820287 RepID=A0ABS3U425_9ACTN|nr:hypothetical protein [Glycomyces sp. NEAU-S30]MBO3733490.1 hypothetical protein [Glycomyces sp. NEAU-S30]